MSRNFAIIGGDLRFIKLAKMLSQEGHTIYTYGLEESEELQGIKNIILCDNLKKATKDTDVVLGPITFSKDQKEIYHPFRKKNNNYCRIVRKY